MTITVNGCHNMPLIIVAVIVALLPMSSEAGQNVPNRAQASNPVAEADHGGSKMKWLVIGMIAAQAADIVTTSIALRRGCTETTYYGIQNKWAIGGMKAGGTVALSVTLPVFHNKRPKLTKTIAWAEIGSGVLGAAFNSLRLPQCQ